MNNLTLCSEQDMKAFGKALIDACSEGGVITLRGDLGSGKTTIVRGALESRGYTRGVRSPTYTLVEHYPLEPLAIAHFDLYRLSDPDELEFLGYRDYLEPHTLCFIEWPEKAEPLLQDAGLRIGLEYHDQCRKIELNAHNNWGQKIVEKLDFQPFS